MAVAAQILLPKSNTVEKKGQTAISTSPPTAAAYNALRESAGLSPLSAAAASSGLAGSLYAVSIYEGSKLIGFGRLVGDGTTVFYVQDVLEAKSRRGQGISRRIMMNLLSYVGEHGCAGAVVGVLSAPDAEPFYERYGFVARPNIFLGAGMSMVLPQEQ